MPLCTQIKKARKNMKMTQKELAEKMFVTPHCVSQWENGKRSISSEMLEPLFQLLKMEIFEIKEEEMDNMSIQKVTYVSVWDGGVQIRSDAKYDEEKNRVFDVEGCDVEGLEICEEQFIEFDDGKTMTVVFDPNYYEEDELKEMLEKREACLYED